MMANNKSTRKSSKKVPKVLKVVEKKEPPAKGLKTLKVVAKGPAFVAAAAAGGTRATINGKPLDRDQAKLWDKAAAALDELRLRVELDPTDLGGAACRPGAARYPTRSRHAPRVRTRKSAPRRDGDGRAPP